MKNFFLLSLAVLFSFSCGDVIDNAPERIDKLRAIGVGADAQALTYSTADNPQSVTLTFVLASNAKTDITMSEDIELDNELQLSLGEPNVVTTDYEDFRIYEVSYTTTIPEEDALKFDFSETAFASYVMRFNQGEEEEIVSGRVKIYRPDNPALTSYTPPSISITAPAQDSTVAAGEVDLQADLQRGAEENYRISWYVASGEVERYRRINTKWSEMTPGTRTIIVAARGLTSYSFTYAVSEATVQ